MSEAASADERPSIEERVDTHKHALDEAHAKLVAQLHELATPQEMPERTAAPVGDQARLLQLEEDNEALRASLHDARTRLADLEETLAVLEAERNQAKRQLADILNEKSQAPREQQTPPPPVEEPAADTAPARMQLDAHDSHGHKRRMGDILVGAGVISDDQLDEALSRKATQPHQRLGEILVNLGYTNEEVIATILAAQLRLPYVKLDDMDLDPAVVRRLPAHLARRHAAIVIRSDVAKLTVAMTNPLDLIAIEDIELATNARVEPVVATHTAVRNAYGRIYGDLK